MTGVRTARRDRLLLVGSAQEVIDKFLWDHEILGHERFLAPLGLGGLCFADTARSVEILATEILAAVRRETGSLVTSVDPMPCPGRRSN